MAAQWTNSGPGLLPRLDRNSPVPLTYGDPRGSAALRHVLASYLRRVRGAVADPERMVICAGFAQGLGLILRTLAAEGARRVAVEEPGPAYREIVAGRAGIEAIPVPVDEHGINVEALAATRTAAVVVTPAHQAPTGVVMAPNGGTPCWPGPVGTTRS